MTSRSIEQLLPELYRCADDPGSWRLVLDQIRHDMDVGSVVVQKLKLNGDRLEQQWVFRDSDSLAHAEAHDCLVNNRDNPRLTIKNRDLPLEDFTLFRDALAAREQASAQAFRDLEERQALLGLANPVILGIKFSEDSRLSLLVHPRLGQESRITDRHGQFLLQLAPHLRQSVVLLEKIEALQASHQTLAQSLDQFNTGTVILNAHNRIHWLSGTARDILQRTPFLSETAGRLLCNATADNETLTAMLASARRIDARGERIVGTLGQDWEHSLQILATPLPGQEPGAVALYISERNLQVDLCTDEVVQLYGLTPAEARLSIALAEGATVNEYAQSRGVSVGTVRIQLKSIFSKLGVSRQPALVRIMGNSITTRTRSH